MLARRNFLLGLSALPTLWIPNSLATSHPLPLTPMQGRGPFYPHELPADSDNDLMYKQGAATSAQGTVLHLSGWVLNQQGEPQSQALVEIWQCDVHGRYHHPYDRGGQRDTGFQGYGRTVTQADGRYQFRTMQPVPYSGRTPHIHFKVSGAGIMPLTTQLYIAGETRNARDFLYRRLSATEAERVTMSLAESAMAPNEVIGEFDIVVQKG